MNILAEFCGGAGCAGFDACLRHLRLSGADRKNYENLRPLFCYTVRQEETAMKNDVELTGAVIDYIEGHLSEKLDLETVAKAVHYSKYHLHRVFAQAAGLTIHDYALRRQLTEAAKLLVYSDRSILEIALSAGYESQQAFTSAFREMYKNRRGGTGKRKHFILCSWPVCGGGFRRNRPAAGTGKTVSGRRRWKISPAGWILPDRWWAVFPALMRFSTGNGSGSTSAGPDAGADRRRRNCRCNGADTGNGKH